ncbi:MAG TPA: prephenate dehydratase [Bacteroidota bacterium]|nr:prephenate dehydratase [Bacteroidota bacterium]
MSRISEEGRVTVAFQGEAGAFSEQAARAYFGSTIRTVPCTTFAAVFRIVTNGSARYGIIPIENSVYGSIHENYDLLEKFNVKITGELKLRIVHALLANPSVRMNDIRYVYSHPQALGQCDRFLGRLHDVKPIAVYDTAGAAKLIRKNRRTDAAAIASVEAARLFGLNVLRKGIETNRKNFTRFLILSRQRSVSDAAAKTSLIFSVKNRPGSLYRALGIFASNRINLFKIESRPLVGKPWEYLFYLDFEGRETDIGCTRALKRLRRISTFMKLLGSYPQGKTIMKTPK